MLLPFSFSPTCRSQIIEEPNIYIGRTREREKRNPEMMSRCCTLLRDSLITDSKCLPGSKDFLCEHLCGYRNVVCVCCYGTGCSRGILKETGRYGV